jgi:multiple sugar transport system permease protein
VRRTATITVAVYRHCAQTINLFTTMKASRSLTLAERIERATPSLFLLPAVLVVLLLSIFPLVLSLYLSFARTRFVAGGVQLDFIGLANYARFVTGIEQKVLIGALSQPTIFGWGLFIASAAALVLGLVRSFRGGSIGGFIGRLINSALMLGLIWLTVATIFSVNGRPGTLIVTLLYVVVGISAQYLIGLGLALLCVQNLPGRRFFRVVYLLPMMITPVGVGYLWRMLADTNKGPFLPLWNRIGLEGMSWANNAWGARTAVMVGDIWQWTPFMFIVLIAALEAQSIEPVEAALVDGANSWQIFKNITWPAILPVSSTVILIRMIEAFKIIDLPNILTNGGPGTATETITLYAYRIWRSPDIGGAAALSYILLVLVTIVATAYANFAREQVAKL